MSNKHRPIWEIMLASTNSQLSSSFTCEDCLAILEVLADAALTGMNNQLLNMLARRHLSNCPDCRQEYTKRLQELESMLKEDK